MEKVNRNEADTTLRLLARMIARAYLKQTSERQGKEQSIKIGSREIPTEESDGDKRRI
ncbi:hypothetical protein M1N05_01550 [Dehalococcoidales bacterium]|nr:hypothetical protein [Dehalococcoidales bacterium]